MIKFYLLIGVELITFPFLYLWEEVKKYLGKYKKQRAGYKTTGLDISNDAIFIIHEWAGYPYVRFKTINYTGHKFVCGLKYHFERLSQYQGKYHIKKILTISDYTKEYYESLKKESFYDDKTQVYAVDNSAMDFSGYAHVVENILVEEKDDKVVFLTNSSVEAEMVAFLDNHIELFKSQPELGLLGISYSTKIYQTLIKNNFRPHLQSFFLVSKVSVLKEMIELNGGRFPGAKEHYKLSIIRFGEVKITELIQKLGYKVAVITEDEELHTLPDHGLFFNGYANWELPLNDYRLSANHPNRINVLKHE